MNRLFRMFGAKAAVVVIALVLFAGLPEFGAMEAEARPRKGRKATSQKSKRGKARARSNRRDRRNGKVRRGKNRRNRREVRGNRGRNRGQSARNRRGGRRGRNGRRVIIKRVRGKNGRIYKRRIVIRDRRGSSRRSNRRRNNNTSYPASNSNTSTASVAPKMVPMRPTRGIVIPEDRAREIQAALKNAGYYQGEVNGKYDDSTREAMRSFQRANGMKDTGTPTATALLKLGLTKHKSEAGDTSAPGMSTPPPVQNETPKQ
jgi:Putative peptidoglycan binding domain